MDIIDGKKVRLEKLKELRTKILKLETKLGLTVIQVGHDPASEIYIKQKRKLSEELGYNFNHINLPTTTTTDEVIDLIDKENNNESIDGIFIQLPLPKHLDSVKIQNAVSASKDVDGLTDENIGRLLHNRECLTACTPAGIIDLLDYYQIPIEGKKAVVIGRSDLVGKPMSIILSNRNATVTLCHSHTANLKEISKTADILVVAIGKPNYITSDYVQEGATVIDVGINRTEDGKIVGDVDFTSVSEKASFITPVPGGVGPMTVYELVNNVYKSYVLRKTPQKH